MPPIIETLLSYAETQGWKQPSWFQDLLDDVLEDFEEGQTLGFWELLYAYLYFNRDLAWYRRYRIPLQYRPYFVNGRSRFWFQLCDPDKNKIHRARLDEDGLFRLEVWS